MEYTTITRNPYADLADWYDNESRYARNPFAITLNKKTLRMSKFWIGNVYLFLAILCSSASQVVFKAILIETGTLGFDWPSLQVLFSFGRVFRTLGAMMMVIAGFVLWIMSLSRLNISYAYAFACSSALLVNFFSIVFLDEEVSVRMWLGTVFIVLGTILLGSSR